MSRTIPISRPVAFEKSAARLSAIAASRRSVLIATAMACVFIVTFLLNLGQIHISPFHPDESRWINRASYIKEVGHPLSSFWGDQYLTRGQPPFGSYIDGLGLLLQGHSTNTNAPFDFHYGSESVVNWEAAHNALPSYDELHAARRTNSFIGALTAALVVLILSKFTNVVGSLIGGLFLGNNGLQQYLSSTALSDNTLGLILVLSTLVVMRLVRKPSWGWTILLGILLGCGMAAKLSPIALAAGFAGIGVGFLLREQLMHIPGVRNIVYFLAHGREGAIDRLGWMLLSLPFITFTTFVVLYPYVWSAPVSRTKILFNFRTEEMASQGRIWPNLKIDGPLAALRLLYHDFQDVYPSTGHLFDQLAAHTPFPAGVPSVDMPFIGLGLLFGLIAVLRFGVATPLAFAFILLGGQAGAIVVGLHVDFVRYYLPILIFLAVCFGYSWGVIVKFVSETLANMRGRNEETESTHASLQLSYPATAVHEDS